MYVFVTTVIVCSFRKKFQHYFQPRTDENSESKHASCRGMGKTRLFRGETDSSRRIRCLFSYEICSNIF